MEPGRVERQPVTPQGPAYAGAQLEGYNKQRRDGQDRLQRVLSEPIDSRTMPEKNPEPRVEPYQKTQSDGGTRDRAASPPSRHPDHRDR
ncbi:hypothetical protein D3C85_1564060 [compost metagenome]